MGAKPRRITLRPAVQRFAEAMEEKLRKHDETRGEDGWDGEEVGWLHDRATEELIEALRARVGAAAARAARDFSRGAELDTDAAAEYVDAANFCMMAFDVLRGR